MEEKQTIGLELRTVHNLIKRRLCKSTETISDSVTAMHGWAIVFFIKNQSQDTFQKDFEAQFSIRRSTATKMLQLMEKKGLIRRESVAYDARLKKIIPTEKSIHLFETLMAESEKMEHQLENGISEEELAAFFVVMEKIKLNLQ